MTRERATSRNVAFAAAAQVVGKLSTFVWMLVAARQMSRGEFGSFNFALSVALLVSAMAEWAFDAVLVQRASREPASLEQHYAEAVAWQSVLALPLFVAAALAVGFARPDHTLRLTLALLLIAVFLELWNDSARSAAAAARNQAGTSAALAVQRLVTMVLAVPVLVAGGGTAALAAVFAASYAVGVVTHQLALRRLGIRLRLRLVTRDGMRAFIAGTWAIGLSALVLIALARVDSILLSVISGDAALGSYAAAYRLFETTLFLVFAVSGAVYPMMSAAPDDAAVIRRSIESGLTAVAVVYLPMAAVCLVDAPGVLAVLFGHEYADTAAGALRWLALAPLPYALAYLATSALAATRRTTPLLLGALGALVVNVALNLALLPHFGATGAGFATTAAYTVEAVALLVSVSGSMGRMQLLRPAAVPAVAATALAGLLVLSPLPTPAEVPVGVLIYAGLWLAITSRTSPDQIEVLRSMAPRRRSAS